jgi:hypothetical protein
LTIPHLGESWSVVGMSNESLWVTDAEMIRRLVEIGLKAKGK